MPQSATAFIVACCAPTSLSGYLSCAKSQGVLSAARDSDAMSPNDAGQPFSGRMFSVGAARMAAISIADDDACNPGLSRPLDRRIDDFRNPFHG